MRALVSAGDPTGAIRHARVHEQLVSQEFGTEASATVIALAEQIRGEMETSVAPPAPVTSPTETSPTDLLPQEVAAVPVSAPVTRPEAVQATATAQPESPVLPRPAMPTRVRTYMVAAAGALMLALAATALPSARGSATRALDQTDLATLRVSAPQRIAADGAFELDPAISPDGRHIAYVAGDEGAMRLYVRQLTGGQALAIAESVSGDHRRPRWSPDGTAIGGFAVLS